jgi:TrmH family RNA methyltransferase
LRFVPSTLGVHSPRIAEVAELLTKRGRDERGAFAFEGATLLDEALRSNVTIRELFVTAAGYEATAAARELDASGVPTYLVEERSFAKLSDVETPTGVLAVADLQLVAPADLLSQPGVVLVLADLNDPGNVGTLLRSADAFGARGVIVGSLGVDPYHPKVVRGAMGAIFRLKLAVGQPDDVGPAASAAGATVVGLAAGTEGLEALEGVEKLALVVGHERHGLGRWEPLCARRAGIPMPGQAESLNAAVAGSIALFAWSRQRPN